MDIITRAEAKERGLKRFFTSVPCKYGHVCERMVSSGNCYKCLQIRDASPKYKVKQKLRRASSEMPQARKDYIKNVNATEKVKEQKRIYKKFERAKRLLDRQFDAFMATLKLEECEGEQ